MTLDEQIFEARWQLYCAGVSGKQVLDHERRVLEEHRDAGSAQRTLKVAVLAELQRMAGNARKRA